MEGAIDPGGLTHECYSELVLQVESHLGQSFELLAKIKNTESITESFYL